jgi:hypothetical protein
MRPRWRGRAGRLEVWYTTVTDPATGTGLWLHHELVAPTHGRSGPYAHGWLALFPPHGRPAMTRFGPVPWAAPTPPVVFAAGAVTVRADGTLVGAADATDGADAAGATGAAGAADATGATGATDGAAWRLAASGGGAPLFTVPRWAWHRELLPAAHVVAAPGIRFTGTVHWGQSTLELVGAPGATARIYGHGNARRWAWLHADLGDGDLCEVVAAVATRPLLNRLPPLCFVRLRTGGRDWPASDPLLAARHFRATIDLPQWTVRGRVGDRRLTITVRQPADRTLAVDYTNPDGTPAVCHSSERADAVLAWERRAAGTWTGHRRWELTGTAHAEVGAASGRPEAAPTRGRPPDTRAD